MTKLQTWNEAKKILEELGLASNEVVVSRFRNLLEPKKAGGTSRPAPIVENDVTYYYCRFTGRYYTTDDMVYQNAEKRAKLDDKGYSNIGMSLWTKGQAYIKKLQYESVEIAYGDDQSDATIEKGRKLMQEYKTLKESNKGNDYNWLVEKFLTDEQSDTMLENSIAKD